MFSSAHLSLMREVGLKVWSSGRSGFGSNMVFRFLFFWVVGRDEDGELEMVGTRGWCGGLVINDQIGFLSLALLRFFF